MGSLRRRRFPFLARRPLVKNWHRQHLTPRVEERLRKECHHGSTRAIALCLLSRALGRAGLAETTFVAKTERVALDKHFPDLPLFFPMHLDPRCLQVFP